MLSNYPHSLCISMRAPVSAEPPDISDYSLECICNRISSSEKYCMFSSGKNIPTPFCFLTDFCFFPVSHNSFRIHTIGNTKRLTGVTKFLLSVQQHVWCWTHWGYHYKPRYRNYRGTLMTEPPWFQSWKRIKTMLQILLKAKTTSANYI